MGWRPLAAAIAAATSLTGAAAQAPPPASTNRIEIIEAEKERYQRMTVPVTIRGQGPFQFMIDTGAEATVLSRDLADRLMLNDRSTATLVAMASTRQVETTPIDDFAIGSRSFYIRQAPVLETAHLGGVDGILGLDSLQDQRVLLDFHRSYIAVADAEALGGNRGYEIIVRARERLGQLIITSAKLDGIAVDVIVDTGAQASIGNMALLSRLRSRSRHAGENTITDVNGQSMSAMVRIAGELRIGRASVHGFGILFADTRAFHQLGLADRPAMILGMEELRLFRRVAIDFKTRRVLFDLPPGSEGNLINFTR